MTAPRTEPLEALAAEMLQVSPISGVAIQTAEAIWGVGSDGEPVVRLALVLDDPSDGVSWDPDVLLAMQTTALHLAGRHGIDSFVYVDLTSRSEAEADDADESDLSDLGQSLDEEFPEDGSRPSHPQR